MNALSVNRSFGQCMMNLKTNNKSLTTRFCKDYCQYLLMVKALIALHWEAVGLFDVFNAELNYHKYQGPKRGVWGGQRCQSICMLHY